MGNRVRYAPPPHYQISAAGQVAELLPGPSINFSLMKKDQPDNNYNTTLLPDNQTFPLWSEF
jgi:hypothetical protein